MAHAEPNLFVEASKHAKPESAVQSEQLDELDALEKVPFAHAVQTVAPSGEYWPATHGTGPVATDGHRDPAGQGVHEDAVVSE